MSVRAEETFEIRTLKDADVEAFIKLRLRALKEEPESFGASYEESAESPISEFVKRLQENDDSFVLGTFAPELVGMVGFYRRPGLKMRHKGNIWGMYVAPEVRGKGIGRALMSAALERAEKLAGLEQVLLAVVTTNDAARRLYLSLGFQPYGIERQVLKLANGYFDEELMTVTFGSSDR